MKIALLPGGFKPPHLGHYNMAKYLADFADKVIVRIGQKEREGIGPELALEVWNYYKAADPDGRAQKLIISVAQSPSPVKDVYDFVEKIAPEGSTVVLGMGEKDAKDGRYNNIPKFAEPRNIKAEIKLVPPQAGGISGTRMREIIKSNNKEEFLKYIPDFLPEEIKEEVWTKLVDSTMPTEVDEMMAGTMNREEMAKHNANMKKLRKFFSKQGDQMTQIPTKLTKGLRRKLYEGSKYDEGTVKIQRLIFTEFKDQLGKSFKNKEWSEYWLEGPEYIVFFDIGVEFIPKKMLIPYSISGDAGEDDIQVKIIYNPESFPESFNDLNAEIKETVRHELEHLAQYNFPNKESFEKYKGNIPFYKYLTLTHETPAFVRGLNKRAKFKKISLRDAFEEFFDDFIDQFKSEDEINTVRQTWSNYAQENLPGVNLEEGKDPKKGTGKKPKGSGRRLYTDENPKDTVGIKFSTRQDIVDTLSKKSFKTKSHARQSQIINLIHQRVRAAYGRAKDPAVKKRLKSGLDYITKRKEASKRKTQRMKKENINEGLFKTLLRYTVGPAILRPIVTALFQSLSEKFPNKKDLILEMQPIVMGAIAAGKIGSVFELVKFINNNNTELAEMVRQASNELVKIVKKNIRLKESTSTFSKDWWLDVINEEILHEGGAAGHMAHPFDLPNVNSGKDLIKSFEQAADSLKNSPGSVKIDGVNASIRLINLDGKRIFAMDRGSKKALDLKGVTKADLEDRFGAGHGMIKAGGNVLDIFNDALPSIQEELRALGLLDDPNIMFNMEYVSGKSNVQDYGKNFLAIHGLLKVETKEVQGARKMLTKRVTTEKLYDKADLEELLKKLEPFAKKKGFEIYGSVPTNFKKDPDFKSALNTKYTVDFAEGDQTKTLAQWLSGVNDIPKTARLTMKVGEGTKDVGALSKQVYFAVFGGENVDDLFDNEQDVNKAIQGATTYLATEKLGDAILDVLDSPMGSVNDHEGVVIRDDKISPKPFKVTGKFITGGVSSQFQKK